MSAKVTSLGGKKLRRNEKVHHHLVEWMRENDERGIRAVVVLAIFEEGTWQTGWMWPERHEGGFPWGIAARGALMAAIHDIGEASNEVPPPKDEDA